ncbi:MAG: adenylate/guanylate cyclase domain-containing protein [Pseudomonadota bacterium]
MPEREKSERIKRRLTTVLCADVQSYSRLMEEDETATLKRLRDYRASISSFVDRHDGRIVNTWGDAVIAEFSSVVEAVQCAVEIQRELSQRNADLSDEQSMWFRIGINLGDVMVEGDDLYGEGVNIAARLQDLAQPGGILISSTVYDQVHNKLGVGFDFLGTQPMKNIADPVPSYRVLLDRQPEPVRVSRASGADTAAESNASSSSVLTEEKISDGLIKARSWFNLRTPRMQKALIFTAGFFAIDFLTGFGGWFVYPSLPILIWGWLSEQKARNPSQDE